VCVQRDRSRVPSLLATALLVAGCTRVSDRSRFEGPEATLEILASAPRPGALGVSPAIRVDLCMSGRIDPRSLDEVDATVSSGGTVLDSQLSVQLVPSTAPGTDDPPEDLEAPWCEGSVLSIQPRAELQAGTQYRLRMQPNAVGWAGESLETEGPLWVTGDDGVPRYVLEFTIDPDPPGEPQMPQPEREPVTLRSLFESGAPFDPARDTCSCHRDPEHLAFERLDLREPTAAFEDLLESSRLRDTGFPMISARDASRSFLVHKLLRTDDDEALHGVLGDPMPPADAIPYEDLLSIIQWIEDGAEL